MPSALDKFFKAKLQADSSRAALSIEGVPMSPSTAGQLVEGGPLVGVPMAVAMDQPETALTMYQRNLNAKALETAQGTVGFIQDAPENASLIQDELPSIVNFERMVTAAQRAVNGNRGMAGVRGLWTGVKTIGAGVVAAKDVLVLDTYTRTLDNYAAVVAAMEGGAEVDLNALGIRAEDQLDVHMFLNSAPEQQVAMMERLSNKILSTEEGYAQIENAIQQYRQEAAASGAGYTQDFTDIRDLRDFLDWTVINGIQGIGYITAFMAVSAMTGGTGIVALGAGTALGEISAEQVAAGDQDLEDVQRALLFASASGLVELGLGAPARILGLRGSIGRRLAGRAYSEVTEEVLERTAKGYARRIGRQAGYNAIGEFFQEGAQFYLEQMGIEGEDFQFTDEMLLGAFNAGMAGALSGGLVGGAFGVRQQVAVESAARRAQEAGVTVKTLSELASVVKDLKLPELSPSKFKELSTKLGLDNMKVFYQAQSLGEFIDQQGLDLTEALNILGVTVKDFTAALEAGARVAVTGTGVVQIGLGKEGGPSEFLINEASTTAQGMSNTEAQQFDALRKEIAAQLQEEQRVGDMRPERAEVFDTIRDGLLRAGRSAREADTGAALVAAGFEAMAKLYGGENMSGADLYAKFGLKVGPEAEGIAELDDESEIYNQSKRFQLDATDVAPELSEEAQAASERGELLPEPSHYLYSTTDSQRLPMSVIRPTRRRSEGVERGRELMSKAALSGQRRQPIAVAPLGDGTYEVLDGNSTYALLEEAGAEEVVVREMTREEFSTEAQIDNLRKVVKDPLKKKRRIKANAMPEATFEAGWELARMKQPFSAIEEMVDTADAQKDQDELNSVLAEVAETLGIPYSPAPTKKIGRASDKVARKYGGEHRLLNDTVRGGMTLGTVADYEVLLTALAERYTIIDEGFNATGLGYMDAKVPVLLPSGRWAEVQVWPPAMKEASRDGGHAAYEVYYNQEGIYTEAQRDAALNYMLDVYAAAIAQLDVSWAPSIAPTLAKNSALAERLSSTRILNAASEILSSTTPSSRNISEGSTDQDLSPENAVADPSSSTRTSPTSRTSKNSNGITTPFDEDIAQSDADIKVLYQSAAVLQEAPLEVEGTGARGRLIKQDVARALTARHLEAHGRVLDPLNNAEDRELVTAEMMLEYIDQLQQHDTGNGWYTADVAQAIEITQQLLPELTDPVKRDLFMVVSALTSVKERPVPNWEKAVDAFEQYTRDGVLPLKKQNGKNWGVENVGRSIQLLQYLIDQRGEQGAVEWLTSLHTGGEIADIRRASGLFVGDKTRAYYTPAGVNLKSEDLGIAMFGPKVSEFFLNASGVDQNAVTIDQWLTQTYNRHIGRLLDVGPAKLAKGEITSQPRNDTERALIKGIIRDLAARADVDPSAMQAALWYFEQRLERSHGLYAVSQNFKHAAVKAAEKRGVAAEEELRTSSVDEAVRILNQGAASVAGDDQGPAGADGLSPLTATDLDEAINDPARLDDFLAREGWAVVTGMQEAQDEASNLAANAELLQILTDAGIETAVNTGMYKGEAQGDSYLILADEATALALGAQFNQESILTNKGLVYIDEATPVTPATGENITGEAALLEDFFSQFDTGQAFSMGLDFEGDTVLEQDQRGQIALPKGGLEGNSAIITLFESADKSTFLHEAGHFFLEMFQTLATSEAAPQAMAEDLAAINQWLGREAGDTSSFATEHHEQWARGFEAYVMEGKAPSLALQTVFSRFKNWLVKIYREATNLQVELSPEIREVMDRMLATEEEIQLAKMEDHMGPMLLEKPAGMSNEAYEAYRRLAAQADDEAERRLLNRAMAKVRRERTGIYKDERKALIKQISEELSSELRYQTVARLQAAEAAGRLNKQELVDRFGKDILQDLGRSSLGGKNAVYSPEGAPIDVVAELMGYAGAEAMVAELRKARKIPEEAANKADVRLNIKYGDILTDGAIRNVAKRMLFNDKKGRLLLAEVRELRRQIEEAQGDVPPNLTHELIKATAHDMVQDMSVKQAQNPQVFLRAERKASNDAQKAFSRVARATDGRLQSSAAKDLLEAHAAKRKQLLNHYLYVESRKVEKLVDQLQRKSRRLLRKDARKKITSPFIDNIDALLKQYDFRKLGPKEVAKNQALADLIGWMQEQGREAEMAIDPRLIPKLQRQHYSTMTVDELVGLKDTLANLEHMGRAEMKALVADQKERFVDVRDSVIFQIEGALKDEKKSVSGSRKERRRDTAKEVLNTVLNSDTIISRLDGSPASVGYIWSVLKAPINASMARFQKRTIKVRDEFTALLKEYYAGQELYQLNANPTHIPELSASLTKAELLAIALNTGNADNWQRLTSASTSQGLVLTESSVRAALEAHLTESDWRFIQSTWDYINSYWGEIAEQERRMTGVTPKKVDAAPQLTPYAFVKGGYYPIRYDARLAGQVTDYETADVLNNLRTGRMSKAQTRHGHVNERLAQVDKPLHLTLSVAVAHVNDVIYDLEMREPVQQAWRILNDKQISDVMRRKGAEVDRQSLLLWVQDVANGDRSAVRGIGVILRHLRSGLSVARMGFSMTTLVQQPLGLLSSMVAVGKVPMAQGFLKYMRHPARHAAAVTARSDFMQERQRTFERDMNVVSGALDEDPTFSRLKNSQRIFVQAAFIAIQKSQYYTVDVPTWLAAYDKALNAGESEENAAQIADQMVTRAQGSGVLSDRSGFERGTLSATTRNSELARLATTFGSYMINRLSLTAQRVRGTDFHSPAQIVNLMVDLLLMYGLETAASIWLTGRWPDFEEEEEDPYLWLGKQTALSVMSSVPLARDTAAFLQGFDAGGAQAQVLEAPASVGVGAVRLISIMAELEDEDNYRRALKEITSGVGVLTHTPTIQMERALTAIFEKDMSLRPDFRPYDLLFGRRDK